MKRLPIAIACVVGLAGAGPALAWHDDYYSHDRDGARYDYARVIEVEPIYDRATLPAGFRAQGPAVVDEFGSTTVVFPGQSVEVDPHGILIVRVSK